jgi:hypothetical protein
MNKDTRQEWRDNIKEGRELLLSLNETLKLSRDQSEDFFESEFGKALAPHLFETFRLTYQLLGTMMERLVILESQVFYNGDMP